MSELGPFCQSCGMPLRSPVDFGTAAQGYRVNEYCRFCYQDGQFTQPGLSLEEMIAQGTRFLSDQGSMTGAEARALLEEKLPLLSRWRRPEAAVSGGRGFTGGDELC